MAQRSVAEYQGTYIGIESVFTVIDGKQINIPGVVEDLRWLARRNELFCRFHDLTLLLLPQILPLSC